MLTDEHVQRLSGIFRKFSCLYARRTRVSVEYFEVEMWQFLATHEQDWERQPHVIASYVAKSVNTRLIRAIKREDLRLDDQPEASLACSMPEPGDEIDEPLLPLIAEWANEYRLELDTVIDILRRGESEVTCKLAKQLLVLSPEDLECAVYVMARKRGEINRVSWTKAGKSRRQYDKMFGLIRSILKAG